MPASEEKAKLASLGGAALAGGGEPSWRGLGRLEEAEPPGDGAGQKR